MIVLATGHILEFTLGEIVYLKADSEPRQRMVTGISLRPNNAVSYALSTGGIESWHFSIEMTTEKTII